VGRARGASRFPSLRVEWFEPIPHTFNSDLRREVPQVFTEPSGNALVAIFALRFVVHKGDWQVSQSPIYEQTHTVELAVSDTRSQHLVERFAIAQAPQ